jgi:hypothetical protein
MMPNQQKKMQSLDKKEWEEVGLLCALLKVIPGIYLHPIPIFSQ